MPRKLTQKEVLERFKKVHGDKYDYSLVEYFEAHTKVKIIYCISMNNKTSRILYYDFFYLTANPSSSMLL